MSTNITLNGTTYNIPAVGESNWGLEVSNYLIAAASGFLQKAGGAFTLTAEVDFGATYGVKSAYLKSRAANPGTAGVVRLGNDEGITWRNAANNADLTFKVNSSNVLEFGGNPLLTLALGNADETLKMNAGGTAYEWGKLTDDNIDDAAAIVYSKLDLADSIVDADIDSAAAIAYSKLDLTGSIKNADIASDADIALSKLQALTPNYLLFSDNNGAVSTASDSISATDFSSVWSKISDLDSNAQDQLDGKINIDFANVTGTLPLANGGTGETTATAAFDALGPGSTKGDLVAHDGTNHVALTAGSDGQVLSADSNETSGLKWISALANPMTTEGDIIIGGTSGAATRLALGTDNQILRKSGSTLAWVDGLATATDPGLVQTFDNANGDKNLASGTYTPTPSYTNVSGGTVNPFNYARVGNIVTVSGSITGLTVTTGGSDINIEFDLPFPPTNNFSGTPDASGHGTCVFSRSTGTINQDSGRVVGSTGTKNAAAVVESTKYGNGNDGIVFNFTFMYKI